MPGWGVILGIAKWKDGAWVVGGCICRVLWLAGWLFNAVGTVWETGFCGRWGWKVKSPELGAVTIGGFMEVKFVVLPETEFGLPACRGKGGCVDDGEGIGADPNPGFVDELGACVWCKEAENEAGFPPWGGGFNAKCGVAKGRFVTLLENWGVDGWGKMIGEPKLAVDIFEGGAIDATPGCGFWGWGRLGGAICPMLLRPRDADALPWADHTVELPEGVRGRSDIDLGWIPDIDWGSETIKGLVGGGWLLVNGNGPETLGWADEGCNAGMERFLGWPICPKGPPM